MSVKVTVPLNRGISTSVGNQNGINTNILSKNAAAKLENLSNVIVDGTTLQDGYTLVFNSVTNKWEAAPAEELSLGNIDGGTY
ncbi:hypothetical protein EBV26_05040 [bacterium]|nr:hypothetical protein [bacterium]